MLFAHFALPCYPGTLSSCRVGDPVMTCQLSAVPQPGRSSAVAPVGFSRQCRANNDPITASPITAALPDRCSTAVPPGPHAR